MKKYLILLFVFISTFSFGQNVKLVSWNIQNFGISKDSTEINYIKNIIYKYDIIAIQEVSSSINGIDALDRLLEQLNEKNDNWRYVVSSKTTGNGTERYAYFFKQSKFKLLTEPSLAEFIEDTIDREPYLATFLYNKDTFMLVNFHAVPTKKKPQREIELLYKIDSVYSRYNIIFMGDFNLSQRYDAFNKLRSSGFAPSLIGVKTSLKMKIKDGQSYYKEYDNFFYEISDIIAIKSYRINFQEDFDTLKEARKISDHCPIVLFFKIK